MYLCMESCYVNWFICFFYKLPWVIVFISVKQLAAHYLSEKRSALELAISMSETSNENDSVVDSVVPSVYMGQFARLLEEGDNVDMLP